MATESEVKNFIKSILTSTPNIVYLKNMNREYANLIGTTIPFRNFGYNSLEHFLKSIPDVCVVQGSGTFAQILPCVTEKTAHIDEMVRKQRNQNAKNYNRPVRRSPSCNYKKNYKNRTYNQSHGNQSNASKYSVVSALPQSERNLNTGYSSNKNSNYHNDAPSTSKSLCNGESSKLQPKTKTKTNSHTPQKSSAIQHDPAIICSSPLSQNHKKSDIVPTLQNDKSFKQIVDLVEQFTIEDEYETSETVPISVQKNLKQLISQETDGIYCYQLPQLYKKTFNSELRFSEYGYFSLIDMCATLKNIFHFVKAGRDDCILFDRNKPRPVEIDDYGVNSYDDFKMDYTDPLPPLQWSDFNFRYDIFKMGDEIPRLFLQKGSVQIGDIYDIMVVDIYDPSKFWFNFGTTGEKTELDNLMDEMQTFYNSEENRRRYAIPRGIVEKGLYCVHNIYGEYHRARVVKILDDDKIKVKLFFFDYGTTSTLPTEDMYFLHKKFAELPSQSIRGRLSNIAPEIKGVAWPRKSCEAFRNLVNQKKTKIKISYIDWENEFICVFLADTTDRNNIVYVNELLVQQNHAVWQSEARKEQTLLLPLFKCQVERLHLFPTFLELESGFVPNNLEMDTLEDYMMPIHYILPHYFKAIDEEAKSTELTKEEIKYSFAASIVAESQCRVFTADEKAQFLEFSPPMNFSIFGELQNEIEADYKERNTNAFKSDSKEDGEGVENTTQHTLESSCVQNNNQQINYIEKSQLLSRSILECLENMDNSKTEMEAPVLPVGGTAVLPSDSNYVRENDYDDSSSSSSDSQSLPENVKSWFDKIKAGKVQTSFSLLNQAKPKEFTTEESSYNAYFNSISKPSSSSFLSNKAVNSYCYDLPTQKTLSSVRKDNERIMECNNVSSIQERRKLMLKKSDAELQLKYLAGKSAEDEYLTSVANKHLDKLSPNRSKTPLRNQWWKRMLDNRNSSPSSSSETDYEASSFK